VAVAVKMVEVPTGRGEARLALRLTVTGCATREKDAVTFFAAFTTNAQPPVPLQAPLQPVNVEPAAGVALRPTLVPLAKLALQVEPQLIPPGLEATIPEPVPALVAVTEWRIGAAAAAQASFE
jgi:hypothetical protein